MQYMEKTILLIIIRIIDLEYQWDIFKTKLCNDSASAVCVNEIFCFIKLIQGHLFLHMSTGKEKLL